MNNTSQIYFTYFTRDARYPDIIYGLGNDGYIYRSNKEGAINGHIWEKSSAMVPGKIDLTSVGGNPLIVKDSTIFFVSEKSTLYKNGFSDTYQQWKICYESKNLINNIFLTEDGHIYLDCLGIPFSKDGGSNWDNADTVNLINSDHLGRLSYIKANDEIIFICIYEETDPDNYHQGGQFFMSPIGSQDNWQMIDQTDSNGYLDNDSQLTDVIFNVMFENGRLKKLLYFITYNKLIYASYTINNNKISIVWEKSNDAFINGESDYIPNLTDSYKFDQLHFGYMYYPDILGDPGNYKLYDLLDYNDPELIAEIPNAFAIDTPKNDAIGVFWFVGSSIPTGFYLHTDRTFTAIVQNSSALSGYSWIKLDINI